MNASAPSSNASSSGAPSKTAASAAPTPPADAPNNLPSTAVATRPTTTTTISVGYPFVGSRIAATLLRRRGQRFAVDQAREIGHRAAQSVVVAALAKSRDDRLGDHALGERVRNRPLEPVADFDAHLAVVLGDQHEHAVVDRLPIDLSAAEPPGFGDADRVLLDRLRRGRADHQDRDLRALARLDRCEALLEFGALGRVQRAGQIGDARRQRGHVRKALRARSPLWRERERGDRERSRRSRRWRVRDAAASPASNRGHGPNHLPCAAPPPLAGAPNSTFGAAEIARSFSTLNCGFASYPNTIAVRFTGNWRTSTLYCWIDSM